MRKRWIEDKTVLISGASSGIGCEIAKILVRQYGCRVVGVARSVPRLQALKNELGNAFCYESFDVSNRQSWFDLADTLAQRGIVVDLVINNAGVMPLFQPTATASTAEVERVLSVNFLASVYAIEAFYPGLKGLSQAGIVNIASSATLCPLAGTAAYTASKAALAAYTQVLSTERCGVYIGNVCPGLTKTALFDRHKAGKRSILDRVGMSAEKMAGKIVRSIAKKKKRRVIGIDAHIMSGCYRLAPKTSPRVFAWFMRISGIRELAGIFEPKED